MLIDCFGYHPIRVDYIFTFNESHAPTDDFLKQFQSFDKITYFKVKNWKITPRQDTVIWYNEWVYLVQCNRIQKQLKSDGVSINWPRHIMYRCNSMIQIIDQSPVYIKNRDLDIKSLQPQEAKDVFNTDLARWAKGIISG